MEMEMSGSYSTRLVEKSFILIQILYKNINILILKIYFDSRIIEPKALPFQFSFKCIHILASNFDLGREPNATLNHFLFYWAPIAHQC